MAKTLAEISEAMRDIDFCTLSSITENNAIASRPMSNNREVEYTGDSYFFTLSSTRTISDVEARPQVGCTYAGKAGLAGMFGKPGIFIHVEGQASVIRDKAQFAAHWDPSLDRWFQQGTDTPGLCLLKVSAERIHYWDGEEEGELVLSGTP